MALESNRKWSDAANKRGYFIGSSDLKDPIRHSFGYPLPHRGHTRNGGAEHGYSRLTDGNPEPYWKSNPYLAANSQATGFRPPAMDCPRSRLDEPVSHIRIDWHDPYAASYEVQYWVARKSCVSEGPMDRPTSGAWTSFPKGTSPTGRGGTATLQLSPTQFQVRYLRIWMTESSNTADTRPNATHDPKDPRSAVGYAIREVYVGTAYARTENLSISFSTAPIRTRLLRCVLRSIHGTPPPTSTRRQTRRGSISSSPAASPTICPR